MAILSDEKLKKQWQKHKQISEGRLDRQHELAKEAYLYYAGDEDVYRGGVQNKADKKMVVFARIKTFVTRDQKKGN